jgi:peptidoglycan/xylan/chitin deacetylase (PgdA/CDA1 family)
MNKELMTMMTVAAAGLAAQGAEWRTYAQTVRIRYDSPEQAAAAQIEKLVLPPGKRVAFSTRWDDSAEHGRMVDALRANGYSGTFYINRPDEKEDYAERVLRKILDNGFSVGSHTTTHPSLPTISLNRQFAEILENRVNLEAITDSCVVAFTLPYMAYTREGDPAMPGKIGENLVRAGLYGGAELWPDAAKSFQRRPDEWIGAFTFGIDDRNPNLDTFTKKVAEGLAGVAAGAFECGPHLSLGVHCWQEDMKQFSDVVATQAGHADWWYCNANQYLAYRMQFLRAGVRKVAAEGAEAVFEITRPVPFELGDFVGLGFKASPAPRGAALGAAALDVGADGAFTLPHDAARALPAKIASVRNADNHAGLVEADAVAEMSGLRASLQAAPGGRLVLTMENGAAEAMAPLHLTFRAPPPWKTGVIRRDVESLAAGATASIAVALGETDGTTPPDDDPCTFAVQLDWGRGAAARRLHALVGAPASAVLAAP